MIDFTQKLTDVTGKVLMDSITMQTNGGNEVELTLGKAASHALGASFQDEQNLSGTEKFRRGKLAFEIYDNPSADLKAEDIKLIKDVMAKFFSPIVIYRAYPMLDAAEK